MSVYLCLTFEIGCDEVSGSSHLENKENADPLFPEFSSLMRSNDLKEISNISITQEDTEEPGHIILVPATKTNQRAAGKCWPR